MGDCNFLRIAVDFANEATVEDSQNNSSQALALYKKSLEYFVLANKYEKNQKLKESIRHKVLEYLSRAEYLQESISKASEAKGNAPNNSSSSGNSTQPQKKTPAENSAATHESLNSENDKMKATLQQAILTEKPNVKWSDIAGLEGAKDSLKEAVILPIQFPHLFTGNRTPCKGILLYGPPGTGKSYLAKAVATEADSVFFSISSSDLVSKWMGESEKLIKNLFQMAREKKPAIIFIDEIDSLCGSRGDGESEASRRIKTEILVQMQGVGNDQKGVLIIGATNIPWQLDSAIRRRFEKRIYIPLPDEPARTKMFQLHVGDTPCQLSLEDYKLLGRTSSGYSGSDIYNVVRDALMQPIRKLQASTHFKKVKVPQKNNKIFFTPCSPGDKDAISLNWYQINPEELLESDLILSDFVRSLTKTKPSVSEDDIKLHKKFTEEFGQQD